MHYKYVLGVPFYTGQPDLTYIHVGMIGGYGRKDYKDMEGRIEGYERKDIRIRKKGYKDMVMANNAHLMLV